MFLNYPDFLIWSVFWKNYFLNKMIYDFSFSFKVHILSPGIYILASPQNFSQSPLKILPCFCGFLLSPPSKSSLFLEKFSDPPPPRREGNGRTLKLKRYRSFSGKCFRFFRSVSGVFSALFQNHFGKRPETDQEKKRKHFLEKELSLLSFKVRVPQKLKIRPRFDDRLKNTK